MCMCVVVVVVVVRRLDDVQSTENFHYLAGGFRGSGLRELASCQTFPLELKSRLYRNLKLALKQLLPILAKHWFSETLKK